MGASVNGRVPIKVTIAQYLSALQVAVAGIVLTSLTAAAGNAVVQDGSNDDIVTLNTTTTNGVAQVWFPTPLVCKGLSVPALSGSGSILYIYLADV